MCTATLFIHQDTTRQRWDDASLQGAYCDLVVGGSHLSVANDTIVITHSMGNNILAGAIYAGRCSLGVSSRWISLSAPWRGSKAADFAERLCADPSRWIEPIQWIARELNYCNGSVAYPAYISLRTDNPILANGTLAAFGKRHVTAALCGTSPFGIASLYSVALEALSQVVEYKEDNDGMVGISSCSLPGTSYAPLFNGSWYSARLNHADGTMRDGDGDLGYTDRQPGRFLLHHTSA